MSGDSAMGRISSPFALFLLPLFFLSGESVDFSEKSQLLELKAAISDPHNMLSSWRSADPDHCSWFGVTCDSRARVSELRIPGGNFARSASCLSDEHSNRALHAFGISRNCSKNGRFLSGRLSKGIGRFSELRVLSLPFHQIMGELPGEIWGLKNLQVIDIEGNSVTGDLSAIDFAGLKNLRVLNLGFNRLFGEIPHSLLECKGLTALNLAGNRIGGSIPLFVGGFTALNTIHLSSNRFTGSLPEEFWGDSLVLEHVDFSGNFFTGKIPKSFGNCRNLRTLLLFSNAFVGALPSELGNLETLEVLDVSRNKLRGGVSASFGSCVKLSVLVLSSGGERERNSFGGLIPSEITMLPNLKLIWAPNSNLVGDFPRNWGPCRSLEMVNLAGNLLGGEISGAIRNCPFLRVLNVSSNKIVGNLDDILNVGCMTVFDVSGNLVSGPIPTSKNRRCPRSKRFGPSFVYLSHFDHKTRLETHFSPSVPFVIHDFSDNNFMDSIPLLPIITKSSRKTGEKIDYASLAGGNKLDGAFFRKLSSVPPQEPLAAGIGSLESNGRTNAGFNPFELILIVVASIIVAILAVLVLLYLYMRRRKRDSRVEGVSSSPPPPPSGGRERLVVFREVGAPLTLDSVVQATENFTSRYCIGSGGFGSTYRAEISPGTTVAVKRLTVEMCQGVPQFNAEIRTLGRIRHPNLVTLIGYYASPSEMFLVYNYLPGGNLERFIRERPNRAIGLNVLHKIALDVAGALSFLHDRCSPRIIHRDVKPSNVLLDADYNAYLSDFGLARLLDGFETHVTTGVAGTFGYVAPEYALTCRASEKTDVYSYGVMLLELISDKRALDASFSGQENGYTIVSWAAVLRREGRPEEVFAAGLWEAGPKEVLLELLHLGLLCTADSVAGRPTMKQVVRKLKQIQPDLNC